MSAQSLRPEPAHEGSQARSGRTAPDGVIVHCKLQPAGITLNKINGPGQISTAALGSGAVDQSQGIDAPGGKFPGLGKAVLHGPDKGEGAAGADQGSGSPRPPPKEKEPAVGQLGGGGNFLRGIKREKDFIA